MQVKRNSVVVVKIHNKPRLALVRSVRASTNKVNVMLALFKRNNTYSDCLVDPSDIVEVTSVSYKEFFALSTCYPDPHATDAISLRLFAAQAAADAKYPHYAVFRQYYDSRVAA